MSALVHGLGGALLHSLWQFALVALGVKLALGGLTESRARYAATLLALASTPLLFLATLFGGLSSAPLPGGGLGSSMSVHAPLLGLRLEPVLPHLVLLWLFGVGAHAGVLLGSLRQLARLRRSVAPAPTEWERRASSLGQRLGLRREVPLFVSPLVGVPSVVGVLRPWILLPASVFGGLPPQQLEAVLLHELVHIRRLDPLVNALQSLVESLFFYHPAVGWLSRTLRQEREHCCDDRVALNACPLVYARALAALETLRPHDAKLSLAASGGSLMNRIRRLVDPPRPQSAARLRLYLLGALLAGLLAACAARPLLDGQRSVVGQAKAFCFGTVTVRAGTHDIPAFNQASQRAMSRALAERGYHVNCDEANALKLDYGMTFSARQLSWQAVLTVSDARGGVLYSETVADAIETDGAFQYTTESNAAATLLRFLEARGGA